MLASYMLLICMTLFACDGFAEPINKEKHSDSPSILKQVVGTMMMKQAFLLRRLRLSCEADLKKFCDDSVNSGKLDCLKKQRGSVSDKCGKQLTQEIGTKPTTTVIVNHGFKIPVGSTVYIHNPSGRIFSAKTTKSAMHKGISFSPGSIYFTGGEIYPTSFSEPHIIDGVKYLPPKITFSFLGQVKSGKLAENTTIGDLTYKSSSGINFFEKNKVSIGVIAKDYLIDGKLYKANSKIGFHRDGKVAFSIDLNKTPRLP